MGGPVCSVQCLDTATAVIGLTLLVTVASVAPLMLCRNVPMSRGDFMIHHKANCVRPSASGNSDGGEPPAHGSSSSRATHGTQCETTPTMPVATPTALSTACQGTGSTPCGRGRGRGRGIGTGRGRGTGTGIIKMDMDTHRLTSYRCYPPAAQATTSTHTHTHTHRERERHAHNHHYHHMLCLLLFSPNFFKK